MKSVVWFVIVFEDHFFKCSLYFLGHHKKKQEKQEKERQEALARAAPVTPPRYTGMGPRAGFIPQRSPRFSSPRQQGPHPIALRASSGPRMRHEPYPMPRRGSLNLEQQGRSPGPGPGPSSGAMKLPVGNKVDGQVIKIEPEEDGGSNQSAPGAQSAEGAQDSSQPASPSANPSTPSKVKPESSEKDDDAKSESSTSTIPNETSDLNKSSDIGPPGGLSLDSDLSNLISAASTSVSDSVQDTSAGSGLDPNVTVKMEDVGDSDMDLEITGVELGSTPVPEQQMGAQDWAQGMMGVMPTGATGGPGDMTPGQQGYSKCPYFLFADFDHFPTVLD